MTENDYIEKRLDDQITWYDKKSQWNQKRFKTLRILEIIIASSIPVLAVASKESIGFRYATIILSALITVIISIQSLYKFHEDWIEYRMIAETLKHEKYLYKTKTGIYNAGEVTTLNLLVERIESIISHENINWSQINKCATSKNKS